MGILDKNKKTTKSMLNSTNSSNMVKNGSKKASYSLNNQNEIENIDPKIKTNEILAEQNEIYHDNPAFEPELANQEQLKNPFDTLSSKKENQNNESFLLETHNQTSNWTNILTNNSLIYIDSTDIKNFDQIKEEFYHLSFNYQGISTQASINNTEKLAAAAAAALSSTAASLVEVPNFGQELSSMMKQNRMDEIEVGSKKEESNIIQNTGYAYGDGNSLTKNMKKSPSSNAIGELNDDAKLKLTGTSASYDIKIRQRRACHLKVLVILVAMLTAGFIGCVFTYYFMRFQMEHQKYLSYTQNMVLERASKLGSNKLEIVVPFTTNVTDINDKNILVNKIEEIVHQTFTRMNKTVDLMQLYELNEIAINSYVATIDVELKDASEFSNVILRKESEKRVKIDDSSDILKVYRNNFLNVTLGLNILPEILTINVSNIDILYDFKMIQNYTEPTKMPQNNGAFSKEKFLLNTVDIEITKTNQPKFLSSIVSASPSAISESSMYFSSQTSSSIKSEMNLLTVFPSFFPFSEVTKALPSSRSKTSMKSRETTSQLQTKGLSRILSTTASLTSQIFNSIEPDFSAKISQSDESKFEETKTDKAQLKLLKNSQTTNKVPLDTDILSSPVSSTDIPPNKILIAEILLNNEEDNSSYFVDKNPTEKSQLENLINQNENIESKLSTINKKNENNGLDIVLQIDGGDSSLLSRLIEKKIHK